MLPEDISQEVAERILEHVFPSGSCVCGFVVVCFLVVCLVRAEVTGSEGTFLAFNKVTPHPAVSLRRITDFSWVDVAAQLCGCEQSSQNFSACILMMTKGSEGLLRGVLTV